MNKIQNKTEQTGTTKNVPRSMVYIILLLTLTSIGLTIYFQVSSSKKIVFIRINESIEKFEGMKEARSMFDQKKLVWKANTDTLEAKYRKSQQEFNASFAQLSADDRKMYQLSLQRQYDDMLQYHNAIEEQAKKEETELITGVVTQINSFAESLAKKRGYDLILGSNTTAGNIMYGSQVLDITQEFITELNSSYSSTGTKQTPKPTKKDR